MKAPIDPNERLSRRGLIRGIGGLAIAAVGVAGISSGARAGTGHSDPTQNAPAKPGRIRIVVYACGSRCEVDTKPIPWAKLHGPGFVLGLADRVYQGKGDYAWELPYGTYALEVPANYTIAPADGDAPFAGVGYITPAGIALTMTISAGHPQAAFILSRAV